MSNLVFAVQETSNTQIPTITGKYKNKYGSILQIEKVNSQYRITASENGGYQWESVGFYSNDCKCIKSIFKYISHKDKYGDHIGYHKFDIKNNGNKIIKYGGWNNIDEFKTETFLKEK